jgi:hypothetical protein
MSADALTADAIASGKAMTQEQFEPYEELGSSVEIANGRTGTEDSDIVIETATTTGASGASGASGPASVTGMSGMSGSTGATGADDDLSGTFTATATASQEEAEADEREHVVEDFKVVADREIPAGSPAGAIIARLHAYKAQIQELARGEDAKFKEEQRDCHEDLMKADQIAAIASVRVTESAALLQGKRASMNAPRQFIEDNMKHLRSLGKAGAKTVQTLYAQQLYYKGHRESMAKSADSLEAVQKFVQREIKRLRALGTPEPMQKLNVSTPEQIAEEVAKAQKEAKNEADDATESSPDEANVVNATSLLEMAEMLHRMIPSRAASDAHTLGVHHGHQYESGFKQGRLRALKQRHEQQAQGLQLGKHNSFGFEAGRKAMMKAAMPSPDAVGTAARQLTANRALTDEHRLVQDALGDKPLELPPKPPAPAITGGATGTSDLEKKLADPIQEDDGDLLSAMDSAKENLEMKEKSENALKERMKADEAAAKKAEQVAAHLKEASQKVKGLSNLDMVLGDVENSNEVLEVSDKATEARDVSEKAERIVKSDEATLELAAKDTNKASNTVQAMAVLKTRVEAARAKQRQQRLHLMLLLDGLASHIEGNLREQVKALDSSWAKAQEENKEAVAALAKEAKPIRDANKDLHEALKSLEKELEEMEQRHKHLRVVAKAKKKTVHETAMRCDEMMMAHMTRSADLQRRGHIVDMAETKTRTKLDGIRVLLSESLGLERVKVARDAARERIRDAINQMRASELEGFHKAINVDNDPAVKAARAKAEQMKKKATLEFQNVVREGWQLIPITTRAVTTGKAELKHFVQEAAIARKRAVETAKMVSPAEKRADEAHRRWDEAKERSHKAFEKMTAAEDEAEEARADQLSLERSEYSMESTLATTIQDQVRSHAEDLRESVRKEKGAKKAAVLSIRNAAKAGAKAHNLDISAHAADEKLQALKEEAEVEAMKEAAAKDGLTAEDRDDLASSERIKDDSDKAFTGAAAIPANEEASLEAKTGSSGPASEVAFVEEDSEETSGGSGSSGTTGSTGAEAPKMIDRRDIIDMERRASEAKKDAEEAREAGNEAARGLTGSATDEERERVKNLLANAKRKELVADAEAKKYERRASLAMEQATSDAERSKLAQRAKTAVLEMAAARSHMQEKVMDARVLTRTLRRKATVAADAYNAARSEMNERKKDAQIAAAELEKVRHVAIEARADAVKLAAMVRRASTGLESRHRAMKEARSYILHVCQVSLAERQIKREPGAAHGCCAARAPILSEPLTYPVDCRSKTERVAEQHAKRAAEEQTKKAAEEALKQAPKPEPMPAPTAASGSTGGSGASGASGGSGDADKEGTEGEGEGDEDPADEDLGAEERRKQKAAEERLKARRREEAQKLRQEEAKKSGEVGKKIEEEAKQDRQVQKTQLKAEKNEAADGASDEQSKADSANYALREKMKEEESKIRRRQSEEEAKASKRAVTQAENVADKASQEQAALDKKVQKAAGAGAAADKEVEKELELAEEKAASAVDTAPSTPAAEMKFRNINHDNVNHEPLKHVNALHKKEGNGAGWVTMSESLANDGDKSVDISFGKKPQIQTVSEGSASTPPTGFMARFQAREALKHAAADNDAQAIMRAEERLRAAEGVDAPAAAVIAAKEDSDKAAHVVPLAEK